MCMIYASSWRSWRAWSWSKSLYFRYSGMGSDLWSGNRFEKVQPDLVFEGITELYLDQTLMPWDEVFLLLLETVDTVGLPKSRLDSFNISSVSRPAIHIRLVKQLDFHNDTPTGHFKDCSSREQRVHIRFITQGSDRTFESDAADTSRK